MTTVEDVSSAPEMIGTELEELQRRILGGGVGDGALVPNQARCLKKGCPAPGGPYVGRGCDAYNRCQGGTPSKLRK
uniref:Uncharacterized protein n=1 Tax=Oryza brachyantha TaxID=4533 RepID=J3LX02_ORYBR